MAAVEKCIQNPSSHVFLQLRKPKKDKEFFYTNWEFSAITNEQGQVVAMQCIGYDTTEIVKAEKKPHPNRISVK